jgi:hypothetical protein
MILLAAALATLVLAHVLRAVRHSMLFPPDHRPRTFHLAVGLSIGYVVNTLLPLRIGELVRGLYVSVRASQSFGAVLATIVFERLTDLVAVSLILLLLPHLIAGAPAASPVGLAAMAGAAGAIGLGAALVRRSRTTRQAIWAATSIFNDRIQLSLIDAAWTLSQLVASRPSRRRSYWLLTLPMWVTYLASYALLGRAAGVGMDSVADGLLARPLSAMISAGPLDRLLLLFACVAALSILTAGIVADGSGIQRTFRRALRIGLLEVDASRSMSRSAFVRDEDYGAVLRAHFTDAKTAAAGFGVHGLDGAVVLRLLPGGSDALTAVVGTDNRLVIRKFAMGDAAAKLNEQARWLREHRVDLPLADIIAERRDCAQFRYDMPYLASAHDLYEMVHVMPIEASRQILREVVDHVDRWHKTHNAGLCDEAALGAYVERKVIANAAAVLDFARLQLPERYAINNQAYALSEWRRLLDRDWVRDQLRERWTSSIHGDLTIENIIVCPERCPGWYLIDPNPINLFDTPLIDWAKLVQSLNLGYEALDRGPPARLEDDAIHLMFSRSRTCAELHDELDRLLEERLDDGARREVAFHELVNYLRLIPYKMRNQPAKAITFFACASVLLRRYEAVAVG